MNIEQVNFEYNFVKRLMEKFFLLSFWDKSSQQKKLLPNLSQNTRKIDNKKKKCWSQFLTKYQQYQQRLFWEVKSA